ncbi:hypothetical protein [Ascidiimonas aurantiaca]|uniref:hypothetical protein n=1 Tax=Ascidiimonas aurantiaca TaxID=1685432 RepID=UPI0030EED9DC
MNRYLCILVFLLGLPYASSQEMQLLKGRITDSVPLDAAPSETYAIYLPSSFEVNKKWPLLFVFEPEGKGRNAVSVFRKMAERDGYIVVSSNAIGNGVISENLKAFDRLSGEVFKKLPIDPRRVYTAGLAGGARLATSVAIATKKMDGVIACGALFSSDPSTFPRLRKTYFIGITGEEDYNYAEMRWAHDYMSQNSIPNELFIFEGGNEWPPQHIIERVFDAIKLRLMKREVLPVNMDTVTAQYNRKYKAVAKMLQINKKVRAVEMLEDMRKNYKPFFDTDSIRKQIRALKKDKVYRTSLYRENKALINESDLRINYIELLLEDLEKIEMDKLGWWEFENKRLDSLVKDTDPYKSKMGKRLKSLLYAAGKEAASGFKGDKETEEWLFIQIFTSLANPEDTEVLMEIIQYATKKVSYDIALYYTELLFKTGFQDLEKFESLEGASLFFLSPEYAELKEKYFSVPAKSNDG